MVPRQKIMEILRRQGLPPEEVSPELVGYEKAREAALKVHERLPSVGILAPNRRRFQAFIETCGILDEMAANGELDDRLAQLTLLILREGDRRFARAARAFDARGNQLPLREHLSLPRCARDYLSGRGWRWLYE